MTRGRVVGWVAAGLAVGLVAGVVLERWARTRRQEPVTTAAVFEEVLSAIRQSFVDSLGDAELYAKAARGVVSTLGDPYSAFLGPAEFRRYRETLRGRGHSVGLTVEQGLTGARVAEVLKGSSAADAGVTPGAYLLEVGGRAVRGAVTEQMAAQLQGDEGRVSLRIRYPGDSITVALELERRTVRLAAVAGAVRLSDRVGYVALRAIPERASRELEEALEALGAEQLDGLLLDLRGNLGGRLDEGLAIADLLLDPGQRIGAVSKRTAYPALYSAAAAQRYPSLRVAVLVDRRTASSAEIVAAALRDNGRALLVGERTLGKGLIQTTIPFGDSAALRLTTGRWRSPRGTTIDGGLVPDSIVAVPAPSPAARALAERADVLALALEALAARRLASGDTLDLLPGDLTRLESRLRGAGVRLPRSGLQAEQARLGLELRRLEALLAGDATGARRLALLADPVVSGAITALALPPGA